MVRAGRGVCVFVCARVRTFVRACPCVWLGLVGDGWVGGWAGGRVSVPKDGGWVGGWLSGGVGVRQRVGVRTDGALTIFGHSSGLARFDHFRFDQRRRLAMKAGLLLGGQFDRFRSPLWGAV